MNRRQSKSDLALVARLEQEKAAAKELGNHLPACTYSNLIYTELKKLFADEGWYGTAKYWLNYLSAKPLNNLPSDNEALKSAEHQDNLNQGTLDYMEFSKLFHASHSDRYCNKGFEFLVTASFVKSYLPNSFKNTSIAFEKSLTSPCLAVEDIICSDLSKLSPDAIDYVGISESLKFHVEKFGYEEELF